MNPGLAFAATFADQLVASGLRDVCISPGSRSAPLAMAFARQPGLRVHVHIDERSCSFFALGMAKAGGRPVAILCTSGTAAAEFHAAVIEAHHSRTPLLVLTADRPPELREAGANQAIDQSHLYGPVVRWFFDPGPPQTEDGAARGWRRLAVRALTEATGPPAGPVHLNLPFREPLTGEPGVHQPALGEAEGQVWAEAAAPGEGGSWLRGLLASARRPLLVAGELRDGAALAPAIAGLNLPVLAEPTSQLRLPATVPTYDALLRDERWAASQIPDLVIRIGAVPTSKALNQWLLRHRPPTVLIDESGWRDPDLLASTIIRGDPGSVLREASASSPDPEWLKGWLDAGSAAAVALDSALERSDLFEAHAVRSLASSLPAGSNLMVGSSMAIRDLDSFWPASPSAPLLYANRGASGIDGLVSTGLGIAAASELPTAMLLGDLSLYHDMNGLWALRRHGLRPLVVVLENDGGGIFSFLPQARHRDVFEELFGTPLGLSLKAVAGLYGLEYRVASTPDELQESVDSALRDPGRAWLVGARFSREGSVLAHRACWEAVAASIS